MSTVADIPLSVQALIQFSDFFAGGPNWRVALIQR